MSLSSDPFGAEVKPRRYSVWVSFSLEFDFECVGCNHFDILKISALKITLEGNLSYPDDLAKSGFYFFDILIDFFKVDRVIVLSFDKKEPELGPFVDFVHYFFGMFAERWGRDLLRELISKYFIFHFLELIVVIF